MTARRVISWSFVALCAGSVSSCASGVNAVPAASSSHVARASERSVMAAHAARASHDPQPRALHYTFSIDAGLTRIVTELCFDGPAPARLVYGTPDAVTFMHEPRLVSEAGRPVASTHTLAVVDDHLQLTELAADSCIRYEIDVRAALERDALLLAYPGEDSLLASAELFLWRPVHREPGLVSQARFALPDGVQVSAPWPEHDGLYDLDESAFACRGHVVFGRFARESVPVPGSALDAIVLDGFPAPARDLIGAWLATAGSVVALPSGSFPVPHAQVIVVPTSPSHFPIRFGYTGRSGGASIILFTPTDMDLPQFRADWIAIHEFSHLLHPFVQRDDAWLSEGLATYLQEILRVRAGLLPKQQAWRRLFEGAQRGRDATQNLLQETRSMRFAGNYERVYWAGAAIALMADVELRRASEGRMTLDDVLARLGHTPRSLSGVTARDLLRRMDELAGLPVFQATANKYLEGAALPDLTALYVQLGLVDSAGALTAPLPAPLGWIRDAIMAERKIVVRLPAPG